MPSRRARAGRPPSAGSRKQGSTRTYAIQPADREAFKRCRRAWDFSSIRRAGYEPARPAAVNFDRAIRDSLAVYYFPGMWEWNRAIVRPLVQDAFLRSLREQGAEPDAETDLVERGTRLLDRYFTWAPTVDDFVPVRVETDFEVHVPDPRNPGHDLVSVGGEPVHYQGRIDLLAVDGDDNYWIVEHRLAGDTWSELDDLLLDERPASFCWAWELFFMGMTIAGVIYNEVRRDVPASDAVTAPPAPASARPGGGRHRRMYVAAGRAANEAVSQTGGVDFRRTRVPRSAETLARIRAQFADEALDMGDPDVRIYPSPSPANCGPCDYKAPCLATNAGEDVPAVLATSYRKRTAEELVEGRLGGVTWAMGRGGAPPRFGDERGPAPRRFSGRGHQPVRDTQEGTKT